MKVLFVGVLIIIALIFSAFVITTPTVSQLSECMGDYNQSMSDLLLASKSEGWNKQKACVEGKPFIDTFRFCNARVAKQSIIPLDLIYSMAKIIKPSIYIYSDRGVIEIHNTMCSDYPDTMVTP